MGQGGVVLCPDTIFCEALKLVIQEQSGTPVPTYPIELDRVAEFMDVKVMGLRERTGRVPWRGVSDPSPSCILLPGGYLALPSPPPTPTHFPVPITLTGKEAGSGEAR